MNSAHSHHHDISKQSNMIVKTVEMRTGGGPLRIVLSGFPKIVGKTLLDKRQYLLDHFDHERRTLLLEPRGHDAMYAAFLVEPDLPEADIAVLFSYGETCGYMCGYATIALGRFAIDYGLVEGVSPETVVKIQCPCGLVTTNVQYDNGKTGATRLQSVPCFVFATNIKVSVEKYNEVHCDIVFGGSFFYAYTDISQFGLSFETASVKDIIAVSMAVTKATSSSVKPCHPELKISYISGTILYENSLTEIVNAPVKFMLVYGEGHAERSGCGSGSCGFLALLYHKGLIKVDEYKTFVNGKTQSQLTGRVMRTATVKEIPAVITEVSGRAFYTGECTFYCEDDDTLPFLKLK